MSGDDGNVIFSVDVMFLIATSASGKQFRKENTLNSITDRGNSSEADSNMTFGVILCVNLNVQPRNDIFDFEYGYETWHFTIFALVRLFNRKLTNIKWLCITGYIYKVLNHTILNMFNVKTEQNGSALLKTLSVET